MKIRKFSVALVASALAVTGLATPTASANEVKVGDEVCTTSESYEGENDLFFETYMRSADQMITNLKAVLTEGEIADLDQYLTQDFVNNEERAEIKQRLMVSGLDAGLHEGEIHSLASATLLIKLTDPWSTPIEELGPIKRSEASMQLLQGRMDLAAAEANSALPSTTSALAWEIAEPQRSWWRTLLETQVNVLEICVGGKDGSFSFGSGNTGGNPGTGDSPGIGAGQDQTSSNAQPSFGSSR